MDEYIEREAAIKAIYESDHFSVRECFGWRAREIEEVLRAVPATPVPQWISVKDRLPDVAGMYIVTACDEWCSQKESAAYLCGVLDERKREKTNADRFRAMSNEEQQNFVRKFLEIEDFADWLKQPSKGE